MSPIKTKLETLKAQLLDLEEKHSPYGLEERDRDIGEIIRNCAICSGLRPEDDLCAECDWAIWRCQTWFETADRHDVVVKHLEQEIAEEEGRLKAAQRFRRDLLAGLLLMTFLGFLTGLWIGAYVTIAGTEKCL